MKLLSKLSFLCHVSIVVYVRLLKTGFLYFMHKNKFIIVSYVCCGMDLSYLARVFASIARSGTYHVLIDPVVVEVIAVRDVVHIHSTEHWGQEKAVDACDPPATHCACGSNI